MLAIVVVAAVLVAASDDRAPQARASVVVLDVESTVLDADDRAAVQTRVARGISEGARDADDDRDVVTTADLRRLANVVAEQQVLDCNGTSACLAELAGAYGAASVVTTRVGKVAGQYVVEVVLLDAHTARVQKRVDASTTKKELLATARRLGRSLVEDGDEGGARPRGPSSLLIGGGVTAGLGFAAAVVGVVGAVLAEGAVRGVNVSGPDKELGFAARTPLAITAVTGLIVGVIGAGAAVAGAIE